MQLFPLLFLAMFLCLEPFGRCCKEGIGFICLPRKSSSFFNRQLGSRACLLTTPGIPPALEAKAPLESFQTINSKQNEAEVGFVCVCFSTYYSELIKSLKVHNVLQTYHHWYGPRTKQTPPPNSQSESGAKDTWWKHTFHIRTWAIPALSLQSYIGFRIFWGAGCSPAALSKGIRKWASGNVFSDNR